MATNHAVVSTIIAFEEKTQVSTIETTLIRGNELLKLELLGLGKIASS